MGIVVVTSAPTPPVKPGAAESPPLAPHASIVYCATLGGMDTAELPVGGSTTTTVVPGVFVVSVRAGPGDVQLGTAALAGGAARA
jgi:hypothetical protein